MSAPNTISRDDVAGALAPFDEATTLPGFLYTDPVVFELERSAIFDRHWVPVARRDQLAADGAFVTFDLAGEPIVVVNDSGTVRALSNVCRHRNMTIVEATGTARLLRCPYHSWSYDLDGCLHAAPSMDSTPGFDPSTERLPAFAVEEWGGWIMVNTSGDAAPFGEQVSALTEHYDLEWLASLQTAATVHYDSAFNWKVQIENFAESYHHQAVHTETLQPLYPGQRSWAVDNHEQPWCSLDHESTAPDDAPPFTATVVFPLLTFSWARPDAVIWFKLQPESSTATSLDLVILTPPDTPSSVADEIATVVSAINDEDVPVNVRTQRGLVSRVASPGRLSHLERAGWQFRRWIAEQLTADLT